MPTRRRSVRHEGGGRTGSADAGTELDVMRQSAPRRAAAVRLRVLIIL